MSHLRWNREISPASASWYTCGCLEWGGSGSWWYVTPSICCLGGSSRSRESVAVDLRIAMQNHWILFLFFQHEGSTASHRWFTVGTAEVMLCQRVQLSSKRGWPEADGGCRGNPLTYFIYSISVHTHNECYFQWSHLHWSIFRIIVECLRNVGTSEWKNCGAWPVFLATAPRRLFKLWIYSTDSSPWWRYDFSNGLFQQIQVNEDL